MPDERKIVEDERVRKYIQMAEDRLLAVRELGGPGRLLEKAGRYLSDGRHYFEKGDNATALASVSYAHGLLDGLTRPEPDVLEDREMNLLSRAFVNWLRDRPTISELSSSVAMDRSCFENTLWRLEGVGSVRIEGDRVLLTEPGRSRITVGLVAGVFDLIHPGHLAFLEWASGHVDVMVAVVARDPNSEVRKGRPPIQSEADRLKIVSSFKPIDLAVLGDREDMYSPVLGVRPDVILLGKDQEADGRRIRADLERRGLKVKIIRSRTWDSGELSKTTKIIDRIAGVLKS